MKQIMELKGRAQAVATAVQPESITAEQVGTLLADMIEAMTGLDETMAQANALVERVTQVTDTLQAHLAAYEHMVETLTHDIQGNTDGLREVDSALKTGQEAERRERTALDQRLQAHLAAYERMVETLKHDIQGNVDGLMDVGGGLDAERRERTALDQRLQGVSARVADAMRQLGVVGETVREITRSDYLGQFATQTAAVRGMDYDYVRKSGRTVAHFEVMDQSKGLHQTATVRTHYYSLGWWHHGLQEMNLGEYVFTRTFTLDPVNTTITYHEWKKVLILNADTPLFASVGTDLVRIGVNSNNRLQHNDVGQGVFQRWVDIGPATSGQAGVMTPRHVAKLEELERRVAVLEKK